MRVLLALASLALVSVALSGCGGNGEPDPQADFDTLELQATATKGLIRGVVVDDAIRPIAGAQVDLKGAAPQSTVASQDGLFGFDELEPGTYFLQTSKPGYKSVQTSVDVIAGVQEPPIARVLMAVDTSYVAPYYEQYVFEGFIECSTGAGAGGAYAYISVCSSSPEAFPNDRIAVSYPLSGYPAWVQAEMVWESTQAVSQSLSHSFSYDDPDEEDGVNDRSVEGLSPLVNTMDNETAREFIEGLEFTEGDELLLQQRIFTVATDGTGPALTVQQRFSVYTTVFYGYLPPEGWTLRESGQVPPPPT